MIVDSLFIFATLTFGWGLSLATYRMFAQQYGWPMGTLHSKIPVIPVLIGLACLVLAFLFAAARGSEFGGWFILILGLAFAVFWTGFLRVASQTSLLLAPLAALLLVLGWIDFWTPYAERLKRIKIETSAVDLRPVETDRVRAPVSLAWQIG